LLGGELGGAGLPTLLAAEPSEFDRGGVLPLAGVRLALAADRLGDDGGGAAVAIGGFA
jgi:hypothetical protein